MPITATLVHLNLANQLLPPGEVKVSFSLLNETSFIANNTYNIPAIQVKTADSQGRVEFEAISSETLLNEVGLPNPYYFLVINYKDPILGGIKRITHTLWLEDGVTDLSVALGLTYPGEAVPPSSGNGGGDLSQYALKTDLETEYDERVNADTTLAGSITTLTGVVSGKANDNSVVHTTAAEDVGGAKNFTSSPTVPDLPDDENSGRATNSKFVKTLTALLQDEIDTINGVLPAKADLDGDYLRTSQIPVSLLGALKYQTAWNASTNTPALVSGVGTRGFYYIVNVAGTTNLNGETDWQIGDHAVYNGTIWQKYDYSQIVYTAANLIGNDPSNAGASTVLQTILNNLYSAIQNKADSNDARFPTSSQRAALAGMTAPTVSNLLATASDLTGSNVKVTNPLTSSLLQSLNGVLDVIATPFKTATAFGKSLLNLGDASALRTIAELGTASIKDTGTGSGKIALNGATLGNSQVVETDASGNLISAAKGTAYNKNTGTGSTQLATGDRGIPAGGLTKQFLNKQSGIDYDLVFTYESQERRRRGLELFILADQITYLGSTVASGGTVSTSVAGGQFRPYTIANTGVTTTGAAGIGFNGTNLATSNNTFLFTTYSEIEFGTWLRIPTLSTGTDTFQVFCGLTNRGTAVNPTIGVYFRINGSTLEAVTNNGSETSVAWGTAIVANTWYFLRIRFTSTSVQFWVNTTSNPVNDVLVATITTTLPTSSFRVETGIVKSLGTTSMAMNIAVTSFTGTYNAW